MVRKYIFLSVNGAISNEILKDFSTLVLEHRAKHKPQLFCHCYAKENI